jgi:hypothetical protein
MVRGADAAGRSKCVMLRRSRRLLGRRNSCHVRDGKTWAIITDDRDDAPRSRPHVDIGTEIEIPNNKLKWDKSNPTGARHRILEPQPLRILLRSTRGRLMNRMYADRAVIFK